MDEVIIGTYEEAHYLLKGVKYIDQMLLGYEKLDCTVGFVSCTSWRDVIEKWQESDGSMPWAIHPKIIQRLKDEQAERELEPEEPNPWDDPDDEGWSLNLK